MLPVRSNIIFVGWLAVAAWHGTATADSLTADSLYVSKGITGYVIDGVPSDQNIERLGQDISANNTIYFPAGTILLSFSQKTRNFRDTNGLLRQLELVFSETGIWSFIKKINKNPDQDTALYWSYKLIEDVRLSDGWFFEDIWRFATDNSIEIYAPILILQRPTKVNIVEPDNCDSIRIDAPISFSNLENVGGTTSIVKLSSVAELPERDKNMIEYYLSRIVCDGDIGVDFAMIEIPNKYIRIVEFDEDDNITFDSQPNDSFDRLKERYLLNWRYKIDDFRISCVEVKERIFRDYKELQADLKFISPVLTLGVNVKRAIEEKTRIQIGPGQRLYSRFFALASRDIEEVIQVNWGCQEKMDFPKITYMTRSKFILWQNNIPEGPNLTLNESDGKARIVCIEQYYEIADFLKELGLGTAEVDFFIPMITEIQDIEKFQTKFGNCS